MPRLTRLLCCLLLPLLLALWQTPAHAKLRFGEVERIRHVANTTLTDDTGARLFLARKIVEHHFLLPYSVDDQGYVLGISGDSKRYYPLPEGERLAALLRAGHLPSPLPPYTPDTLDLVFGHALWVALAALLLWVAVPWGWRRLRGAQAPAEAQDGLAATTTTTSTAQAPPFAPQAPPTPRPLPVQLPLRLRPKRLKHLSFLALCCIFVAIGVMMFKEHPAMGALCAGFFGLGIPVFIVQMLPGASFLDLSADGFVFRSLFKRHSVLWRDIASLHVVRVQGRTLVGWNHVPSYAGLGKGHQVSRALCGVDAALPDTYGLTPNTLVELMGLIHDHHQHQHQQQPHHQTQASA